MFRSEDYEFKPFVSKEFILERLTDEEIFRRYFPYEISLHRRYPNIFSPGSSKSLGFFLSKSNRLLLKDFRTDESYDCFGFLVAFENITITEAFQKIAADFNLVQGAVFNSVKSPTLIGITESKRDNVIKVKTRRFSDADKAFWQPVTLSTLKLLYIFPVATAWLNDRVIYAKNYSRSLCYAYLDKETDKFKIYQPYNPAMKWINNFKPNTWCNLHLIKPDTKVVIITSSRKDSSAFIEAGYVAINPQSEGIREIPEHVLALLDGKTVLIAFDNDEAGRTATSYLTNKYPFIMKVNYNPDFKDPFALVKEEGLGVLKIAVNERLH